MYMFWQKKSSQQQFASQLTAELEDVERYWAQKISYHPHFLPWEECHNPAGSLSERGKERVKPA